MLPPQTPTNQFTLWCVFFLTYSILKIPLIIEPFKMHRITIYIIFYNMAFKFNNILWIFLHIIKYQFTSFFCLHNISWYCYTMNYVFGLLSMGNSYLQANCSELPIYRHDIEDIVLSLCHGHWLMKMDPNFSAVGRV